MAIDSGKIWKIFRKGGLWLAVTSLVSTLVFGIIDNLTSGLIPYLSDSMRDKWSPPKYMITFSVPVELDTEKSTFDPLPKSDKRKVQIAEIDALYVTLSGPPGEYRMTLRRPDRRFLPTPLTLKRNSDSIRLDTSDGKWERPEVLSKSVAEVQSPDASKSGAEVLRDVRWSTTSADFDQIPAARTHATKTILSTALGEVGAGSSRDSADKARIYDYWSVIPNLREMNQITRDNPGPWGGAFLTWVASKSQVEPPQYGSAYDNWANWAQSVPIDHPEPGMVALFATKAVAGLRGSYLAGVFLRKWPDCTEIITGNIANRMVIACVALPIASLRQA